MMKEFDFDVFFTLHLPHGMKIAEAEKIMSKVIWRKKDTVFNSFGAMPAMSPPHFRSYHGNTTTLAISVKDGRERVKKEVAAVARLLKKRGIPFSGTVEVNHFPRVH